MSDLPETYQGMIQYIAFAESQIKRNNHSTKKLQEVIAELKPKIKKIQDQLEVINV